jgi:hypothetical protein
VRRERVKALSTLYSSEIEKQAGVFAITEKRRCKTLSPFHHLTIEYSNFAVCGWVFTGGLALPLALVTGRHGLLRSALETLR